MKRILLLLFLPLSLFARSEQEEVTVDQELVIYTYESFAQEWGAGPQVVPLFEEKYGIKVIMKTYGDAGSVLQKVINEKEDPVADIIIGPDNNMLAQALDADILEAYKPKGIEKVPAHLIFDDSYRLIPFDYGYFSIIYDTQKIENPPRTLEDLTKEEFKESLILMDPRTSSPGLGFLLWTVSVYGEEYLDYWNRLKPSILTITDGWTSGYGLFTKGEAPMVLSYTTSPPYHVAFESTDRFQATVFEEGNYMQIEGMGIIKGAKNRENAQKFLDFMLTEAFQDKLPLTNFMFPVNQETPLPESYEYALKPEISLQLNFKEIEENYQRWLDEWAENSVQ